MPVAETSIIQALPAIPKLTSVEILTGGGRGLEVHNFQAYNADEIFP